MSARRVIGFLREAQRSGTPWLLGLPDDLNARQGGDNSNKAGAMAADSKILATALACLPGGPPVAGNPGAWGEASSTDECFLATNDKNLAVLACVHGVQGGGLEDLRRRLGEREASWRRAYAHEALAQAQCMAGPSFVHTLSKSSGAEDETHQKNRGSPPPSEEALAAARARAVQLVEASKIFAGTATALESPPQESEPTGEACTSGRCSFLRIARPPGRYSPFDRAFCCEGCAKTGAREHDGDCEMRTKPQAQAPTATRE